MKQLYGLYLYRSSQPLYVGTQADCYHESRNLSDAEWLHGWTIKPYTPSPAKPYESAWAFVGAAVLLCVAGLGCIALLAHIH